MSASSATSSGSKRVALVTGGNKGVGYAICSSLASHPDITVILTARDMERGKNAVDKLAKEGKHVHFRQLDVDDLKSIENAATWVKETYGGIDILINNAGIATKGDALEPTIVASTFRTNVYGIIDMCNTFFRIMRQHGRVVHMSSSLGKNALNMMSKELREQFMDDKLTIEGLQSLLDQYASAVIAGDFIAKGWPRSAYGISKAAILALTRIQARDISRDQFVVNAVCPGFVKTDMTGNFIGISPDQGAETPVWAALLPVSHDTPHGAFLKDKTVQSYPS